MNFPDSINGEITNPPFSGPDGNVSKLRETREGPIAAADASADNPLAEWLADLTRERTGSHEEETTNRVDATVDDQGTVADAPIAPSTPPPVLSASSLPEGLVDGPCATSTPKMICSTASGPHAPLAFPTSGIKVGGENQVFYTILFLFDTGSPVEILSLDTLNESNLQNTNIKPSVQNLHGLTGQAINIIGELEIPVIFNDERKLINFVIVKEPNIAIFGMKGMQAFGMKIDLDRKLLLSNGHAQKFAITKCEMSKPCGVYYTEEKGNNCNVFLMYTEIIPPASTKLVQCYIKGPLPATENVMLEYDYAKLKTGCIIATCIMKTQELVYASVHNMGELPCKLKKDSKMGYASGCDLSHLKESVDLLSDENLPESIDNHPLQLTDLNHLPDDKRKQLEIILRRYHCVWARHDLDIGKHNAPPVRLPLKPDHKVVREAPRRYNAAQRAELERQVAEMLETDVIEESTDCWRSFPVLASKKSEDGSLTLYKRFCVDLRACNLQWQEGDHLSRSLPRCSDLFSGIASAIAHGDGAWYAKLDIQSAFFNLVVDERDRAPLTFAAPERLFRFKRLPFGCKLSPSIFQKALEQSMYGLAWHSVFIFLDDMIVVGRNWPEFLKNFTNVLHRLAISGFKLKPKKCMLACQEIPVLGFVLTDKTIKVDPHKLRAASCWPRPTTQKEALSFIQFISYNRKFVEDFAKHARPIYDCCNQPEFQWNEQCEKSFHHLKAVICSDPSLRLLDAHRHAWLFCDWSAISASWSILQRSSSCGRRGDWYAVLHGSKAMTKTQGASFSSNKGEIFTLCHSLKECREFLNSCLATGANFSVFSDHKSLLGITTQKEISAYQLRMLNAISELGNFPIYHRPGTNKQLSIVDRLSRTKLDELPTCSWTEVLAPSVRVNAVTRAQSRFSLADGPVSGQSQGQESNSEELEATKPPDWLKIQEADNDIRKFKQWVKHGFPEKANMGSEGPCLKSYFMNRSQMLIDPTSKLLVRRWTEDDGLHRDLVVVPTSMANQILYESHDLLGHSGYDKTLAQVRRHYYFFSMAKEAEIYVKSCEICQRRKASRNKTKLVGVAKTFFNEYLYCDAKTLDKYRSPEGHTGFLIMVEGFSKLTTLAPIKGHTSSELASTILRHYCLKHGFPHILVTDREQGFMSKLSQEFYDLVGIKKRSTVSHRAQSDGLSEIMIKHVSGVMAVFFEADRYCNEGRTDSNWHLRLPQIEFCINSLPQSKTHFSPYFLATGRDPIIPSTLYMAIPQEKREVPASVREMRARQAKIFEIATRRMDTQRVNQSKYYDSHTFNNHIEYKEGDEVLYRDYSQHVSDPTSFRSMFKPTIFEIVKCMGVNYLIQAKEQHGPNKEANRVVHFNQLKPFVRRDADRDEHIRQTKQDSVLRTGIPDLEDTSKIT